MAQKKNQNNKIILTISLLVSNRIETIRKCMDSMKPILEALPSELIAVDTIEPGKSDGSIDIVREYTENIIPFTWCNDFSAARNAGLEKAQGEWFMYIDDDEWFEDPSPVIDFFQSGKYRQYNSACYTVRNYTNREGTAWVETTGGRLFPIEKGTRFEGKVHEMVPARMPEYFLPCYVHHYGYVFQTAAEKAKHIERNLNLLTEEYELDKGNHRTAAHLIQEYEGSGRFEESLKIIQESTPISTYTLDYRFRHFLKLHEVLDYIALKDFPNAYEAGKAYLGGNDRLLGAEIGIAVLMVEICYQLDKIKEGMQYLEQYFQLIEELGKREDQQMLMVLDMSQLWNEKNIKTAYARGVNLAYKLGDMERCAYFIRKMDWREKELIIVEGTVDNTFHFFESVPFEPWMTEVMEAMLERGFSHGSLEEVMKAWPAASPERKRLLQVIASCKNPGVQISMYRAEYATLTEQDVLLRQALQELVDNPDGNLLMLKHSTLQYMQKAGIDGAEYVDQVPLYKWDRCVTQWFHEKNQETRRKDCFFWRTMMPGEPLYLLYLETTLEGEEIQAGGINNRDFEAMHQSILGMAEKNHQLYSRIYHPDTLENGKMFTLLPPNAQFAEKYLQAAECLEQNDIKGFVSLVKEAGICCPAMGQISKLLLEKYRDQQPGEDEESRKAQQELDILMRNLERKAEQLWEGGQQDEATSIIRQILQIRPDVALAEKYHITIG